MNLWWWVIGLTALGAVGGWVFHRCWTDRVVTRQGTE